MLRCETCGYQFDQQYDKDAGETQAEEERKTGLATQANKQGPFCWMCRHLEMARRYAEVRRLGAVVTGIEVTQSLIAHEKKSRPVSTTEQRRPFQRSRRKKAQT